MDWVRLSHWTRVEQSCCEKHQKSLDPQWMRESSQASCAIQLSIKRQLRFEGSCHSRAQRTIRRLGGQGMCFSRYVLQENNAEPEID